MYKINQIFKLQLKCIKRSLFLPILLIAPLTLLLLRYNSTIDKSGGWLSVWASTITYGYMIAALCCIILGIYIANNDYEAMYTLGLEERKVVIGKIFCLLIFTLIMILEPLSIVLFHLTKFKNPSSLILTNILINLIITWGTGLTFASIMGFSIGYFIKDKLSYIVGIFALFIISPYNKVFITDNAIVNTIYSLINIDINNINMPIDVFTQSDFNLFWIYDKLFLVLLIIGLITLCVYKKNMCRIKNWSKGIFFLFTIIVVGIFLFSRAVQYYPQIYIKSNIFEEYAVNDMITERYDMNIKLGNKLNNICTIEMINKSDHDVAGVKLYLDKVFNIKNINYKNRNLNYQRKGNIVDITFNEVVEPKQKINITIAYNGYVNYKTNMGFDKYFTSLNSTFLPPDEFIWYPRNNGDNYKHFTINVKANNRIYSNLRLSNNKKNSTYEYLLTGNKKEIYIIAGYLNEKNIQGNNIIGPDEYLTNNSSKVGIIIKFIKEKLVPKIDPSLRFVKAVEGKDRPIYFVPLAEEKIPYRIYDDCVFINSYILSE